MKYCENLDQIIQQEASMQKQTLQKIWENSDVIGTHIQKIFLKKNSFMKNLNEKHPS